MSQSDLLLLRAALACAVAVSTCVVVEHQALRAALSRIEGGVHGSVPDPAAVSTLLACAVALPAARVGVSPRARFRALAAGALTVLVAAYVMSRADGPGEVLVPHALGALGCAWIISATFSASALAGRLRTWAAAGAAGACGAAALRLAAQPSELRAYLFACPPVIVGVLAVTLTEERGVRRGAVAWRGGLAWTGGLALVVWGETAGSWRGWIDLRVLTALALATVLLVALFELERDPDERVHDLRQLRRPQLAGVVGVGILGFALLSPLGLPLGRSLAFYIDGPGADLGTLAACALGLVAASFVAALLWTTERRWLNAAGPILLCVGLGLLWAVGSNPAPVLVASATLMLWIAMAISAILCAGAGGERHELGLAASATALLVGCALGSAGGWDTAVALHVAGPEGTGMTGAVAAQALAATAHLLAATALVGAALVAFVLWSGARRAGRDRPAGAGEPPR